MFQEVSICGSQTEQRKKRIIKIFKRLRAFNNRNNEYNIYRLSGFNFKFENSVLTTVQKTNNDPIYVDIISNHPPQLYKQLPKVISKRLSGNSSSKDVSDKSKTLYKKSLNNSGFYEDLIYHQDNGNKNQHKKIKKC